MHHTGIVADPNVKKHDTGPGHPEQAARYSAVMNRLEASGVLLDLTRLDVRHATDDEVEMVHTYRYMKLVQTEVADNQLELSTGDTAISPYSMQAARSAAGCTLNAVDAVLTGAVQNAFCVVRPPGHHASAGRGMGFCIYNNIAIAARYAQQKHGLDRVAIVDWDVHHGNGTQDIFYNDGSVFFFSTHQSPWYPGTGDESERGEGAGEGTTLNCPLPAGSGRTRVFEAFRKGLFPAVEAFRPELILLSAGFDSRVGDPLGNFVLNDDDFYELTTMMMDLASQQCGGRLVSVLEGGYALEGLGRASLSHVRALIGH